MMAIGATQGCWFNLSRGCSWCTLLKLLVLQIQVGRNSDIYVTMVSYTHQVAAKGWFIAMVSTTVETANPEAEIQPGEKNLSAFLNFSPSSHVSSFLT